MKKRSLTLAFTSTPQEVKAAAKAMLSDVYKIHLGHEPIKADHPRIEQRNNPDNISIVDHYIDGRKVGALRVTYIIDSPRAIVLDFTFQP